MLSDDPLETAIALKEALVAEYGYDIRKLMEGLKAKPLDPKCKVIPAPEHPVIVNDASVACGFTTVSVPDELLQEIRKLIAKRQSARQEAA